MNYESKCFRLIKATFYGTKKRKNDKLKRRETLKLLKLSFDNCQSFYLCQIIVVFVKHLFIYFLVFKYCVVVYCFKFQASMMSQVYRHRWLNYIQSLFSISCCYIYILYILYYLSLLIFINSLVKNYIYIIQNIEHKLCAVFYYG